MVMICQQCGDRGFENAFIFCVKCLGFVIHRYCLYELPETLDEIVYWVCEDCESMSPFQSAIPSHYSLHTLEQDYTSSVHSEETHSREKLKMNGDAGSLVDGIESKDFKHDSLPDCPVKINLKMRKKSHSANLADETVEGSDDKVIRETVSEHVQLAELDSVRKKAGNSSSVLNEMEENSCSEAIREPDRECVSYPLAPLQMKKKKKKKRTKLRNISSVVDSCHKLSIELEQECVPLAELCLRRKLKREKKVKKKCFDSIEDDNGCGKLTKEPNCQGSALANSPLEVNLKKTTNEKDTEVAGADEDKCQVKLSEEPFCKGSPLTKTPVKVKSKKTRKEKDSGLVDVKGKSRSLEDATEPKDESVHLKNSPLKANLKRKKDFDHIEAGENGIKRQSISSHQKNGAHQKHDSAEQAELGDSGSSLETMVGHNRKEVAAVSTNKQTYHLDSSLKLVKADKKLDNFEHDNSIHSTLRTEDVVLNSPKEQLVMKKGNEPQNEVSQFEKFDKNFQTGAHVQAQPVLDPIWVGIFNISNKDYELFEGLVGHVSNKVGFKVFHEATMLPSEICLEMLPKSDLWPKSFQENKPSDENIAMYFFPKGSKQERFVDSLVDDMMKEELAMRATVTNAELLIFTSAELPKPFWRFRDKYYLWGVFKTKRVNPSPPPTNHL